MTAAEALANYEALRKEASALLMQRNALVVKHRRARSLTTRTEIGKEYLELGATLREAQDRADAAYFVYIDASDHEDAPEGEV